MGGHVSQRVVIGLAVIALALFSLTFFSEDYSSPLTGYAVYGQSSSQSLVLNETFAPQDGPYVVPLDEHFPIEKVAISGAVNGSGEVLVIITDGRRNWTVYGDSPAPRRSRLTGMVIGSGMVPGDVANGSGTVLEGANAAAEANASSDDASEVAPGPLDAPNASSSPAALAPNASEGPSLNLSPTNESFLEDVSAGSPGPLNASVNRSENVSGSLDPVNVTRNASDSSTNVSEDPLNGSEASAPPLVEENLTLPVIGGNDSGEPRNESPRKDTTDAAPSEDNASDDIVLPSPVPLRGRVLSSSCLESCDLPGVKDARLLIIVHGNASLRLDTVEYVASETLAQDVVIPDALIGLNDTLTLNVSEYFPGAAGLFIDTPTVKGLETAIEGELITITPARPGVFSFFFYLTDGEELLKSNTFTIKVRPSLPSEAAASVTEGLRQAPAVAGKPVSWTYRARANATIDLNLTEHATDIKVTSARDGREVPLSELRVREGGKEVPLAGWSPSSAGPVRLALNGSGDEEYLVTYETPAPSLQEHDISPTRKQVTVSSDIHYRNVSTSATLPTPAPRKAITLRWENMGLVVPPENITYHDDDGDGLIERISWVVPHLSEQVFLIDIAILNPLSYLKDGDTWTVLFNTTGTANLTITSPNAFFQELPVDDNQTVDELSFIDVACDGVSLKDEVLLDGVPLASFSGKPSSFTIPDYSCNGTGSFTTRALIAGYATLRFDFASYNETVTDYAYDPPISITNCTELQAMQDNLTADYVLANDIDCSDTVNWNSGAGFDPVGQSPNWFQGSLDGKGHVVNGLFINRPSTDYVGLFSNINTTAVVKNIGITNANVTGANIVGILCMRVYGVINNSYTTGRVETTVSNAGGLCGSMYYGDIYNSFSNATVVGGSKIGGLVGFISGMGSNTIADSYATGNVTGDSSYVGGLVGYIDGAGTITRTYATGSLSGVSLLGGLVGGNVGTLTVSDSFYDNQTTGQSSSAGGTGRTTAQMMDMATYSSWDIANLTSFAGDKWYIDDGNDYPRLGWGYATSVLPFASSFDGATTDFSALPDISSAGSVVLENSSYGAINWSGGGYDVINADFDANVRFGQDWVYVDSLALHPSLNSSANVTFYNVGYQYPLVYRNGAVCSSCQVQSFSGGELTFSVTGFSNYSIGSNSYLGVWDDSDVSAVANGSQMTFYANYSNSSSGAPISSNAYCEFTQNSSGSWSAIANMTYNPSSLLYEINRTFSSPVDARFNVSCYTTQAYGNLTTNDGFSVVQGISSCGEISAAGDYYLMGDVSSNTTCFNITADGVSLHGQGFTVGYSNVSDGAGVLAQHRSNIGVYDTVFSQIAANPSQNGTSGIFFDHVNDSVISNNSVTTTGSSSFDYDFGVQGISINASDNVSIIDNHVVIGGNDNSGIYLKAATNSLVAANNVTDTSASDAGIYLVDGSANTVRDNYVDISSGYPVNLRFTNESDTLASNNTLILNTNINNQLYLFAISISDSHNITLRDNNITLELAAAPLSVQGSYDHDIDPSNLVDGLPIRYNYSLTDTTISGADYSSTGPVICAGCTNTTYDGITMGNKGLYFFDGINNSVVNTVSIFTGLGVFSYGSNATTIRDSSLTLNNSAYFNTVYQYGGHGLVIDHANVTVNNSYSARGLSTASTTGIDVNGSIFITDSDTSLSSAVLFGTGSSNINFTNNTIDARGLGSFGMLFSIRGTNNFDDNVIYARNGSGSPLDWYGQFYPGPEDTYFRNLQIIKENQSQKSLTIDSGINYAGSDQFVGLINVSFNYSDILFGDTTSTAWVRFFEHADVNVTDKSGVMFSGANVSGYDVSSILQDSVLTDGTSLTRLTLPTYDVNGTTVTPHNNYTINASKTNFISNATTLNITDSLTYTSLGAILLSLAEVNVAPSVSSATLSASSPWNKISDNLSVSYSASDPNSDPVTTITDWRLNGNSIAVLHMPFDVNVSSVSAGAVRDYSTFENNGTLGDGSSSNAPSWNSSCMVGGCYDFDGSSEIDIPQSSSVNISDNSVTIAAWVRFHGVNQTMVIVSKIVSNDSHSSPYFSYNIQRFNDSGGDDYPRVWVSTQNNNFGFTSYSGDVIDLDQWYHIVGVYDGSSLCTYLNGSLLGSCAAVTGNLHTYDTPVRLGSNGGHDENLSGLLDEVYVFDRALSSDQVQELYTSGLAGHEMENLSSSETAVADNWTVALTPNDGLLEGPTVLSNSLYISNDLLNITSCRNITFPGPYTLTSDISAAGTCLEVQASDVSIDCQGHSINYSGSQFGVGIFADGSAFGTTFSNITISNCSFYKSSSPDYAGGDENAIYLEDVNESLVQDSFTDLTVDGWSKISAVALYNVDDSRFERNDFTTNEPQGDAIYCTGCDRDVFDNNTLRSVGQAGSGFFASNSYDINLTRNTISHESELGYGLFFYTGDSFYLANNSVFANASTNDNDNDNGYGIKIRPTVSGVTMRDNNFTTPMGRTFYFIYEYAAEFVPALGFDIDTSNLADGLPILYNESLTDYTFENADWISTYGEVVCANCTNVTYRNISFAKNTLNIFRSYDMTLTNLSLTTADSDGLNIWYGSGYNVSDLRINATGMGNDGLLLVGVSDSSFSSINASSETRHALAISRYNGAATDNVSFVSLDLEASDASYNPLYVEEASAYSFSDTVLYHLGTGDVISIKNSSSLSFSRVQEHASSGGLCADITGGGGSFGEINFSDTRCYTSSSTLYALDDAASSGPLRLINATHNVTSPVSVASGASAQALVYEYVDVNVTNSTTGSMVSGANVSAYDVSSTLRDSLLTDGLSLARLLVLTTVIDQSSQSSLNNYTFSAYVAGFVPNSTSRDINDSLLTGTSAINLSLRAPGAFDIFSCHNITAPGYYRVYADLSSNGTCFDILSDNVTIDGRGHSISYGGLTTGYAFNLSGRTNVTVKDIDAYRGDDSDSGSFTYHAYNSSSLLVDGVLFYEDLDGSSTSVRSFDLVSVDNITISGVNSSILSLDAVTNSTVRDSYFHFDDSYNAVIMMADSFHNTVVNNTLVLVSPKRNFILSLDTSSHNSFHNNTLLSTGNYEDMYAAVDLYRSTNDTFVGNSISTYQQLLWISALTSAHYNHTFTDNLAEGLPLLYNLSLSDTVQFADQDMSSYGGVICALCSNVTYDNLTFGSHGLMLMGSSDINVFNATFTGQPSELLTAYDSMGGHFQDIVINSTYGGGESAWLDADGLVVDNLTIHTVGRGLDIAGSDIAINGLAVDAVGSAISYDGTDAHISGANITSSTGNALGFYSSSGDLYLYNVSVSSGDKDAFFTYTNGRIFGYNATIDLTNTRYTSSSSAIYLYDYVDVNVTDSGGSMLSGVNVSGTDGFATLRDSVLNDGLSLARLTLLRGYNNESAIIDYNNFTIEASLLGYGSNSTSINLTDSSVYAQGNHVNLSLSFLAEPYLTSVTILPSSPLSNDTLRGYCNATDNQGDPVTYYYRWYLDGSVNETGSTPSSSVSGVEVNVDNISSSWTAPLQSWILSCRASDGSGNSTWLNSSSVSIPQNNPPSIGSVSLNSSSGFNVTTDSLFLEYSTSDVDGDPVQVIPDWRLNGSSIAMLNFPFDKDVSSVSSGAVRDYTTFENNGTLGNGAAGEAPAWTSSCVVGGCYSFDGVDDEIRVADSPSVSITGDFTVLFWMKPSATSGYGTILCKEDNLGHNSPYCNYAVDIDYGSSELRGFVQGKIANMVTIDLGVWQQVAFTFDDASNVGTYYINGSNVASSSAFTSAIADSTAPLLIGNSLYSPGGDPYNGSLDELLIINRTLSPEQIELYYQAGLAGHKMENLKPSETLVGDNWSVLLTPNDGFDDGSSALTNDLVITTKSPPSVSGVVLNATSVHNESSDNLTIHYTTTDPVGALTTTIPDWRRNGSSVAVLNLPFDSGVEGLSEGAIRDYSSYANNGTLGGGNPAQVPDFVSSCVSGGCYYFDGANNDFINFSDSASLSLTDEFTFVAWIKPEDYPSCDAIVSKEATGDHSYPYDDFGIGGACADSSKWQVFINGSVALLSDIDYDSWQHIAATFNDATDTVRQYVNGSLTNETTTFTLAPQDSPYQLRIGTTVAEGNSAYKGYIDELYLFDRELSAQQIQAIFDAGLAGHGPEVLVSQETADADNWTVALTPNDGAQDGVTVLSDGLIVGETAPLMSAVSLSPASPVSTDTLRGYCNASDWEADNITYYYRWYLDGSLNSSGVASSDHPAGVEVNVDNISSSLTADGQSWTFSCLADDGMMNSSWVNSSSVSVGLGCGALIAPGTYSLSLDVNSTGTCFSVNADNVTLDCQGHVINYSTSGADAAYGVFSNRFNTTVRNCRVVDGDPSSSNTSRFGVYLYGATHGSLVNTTVGVNNSPAIFLNSASNISISDSSGNSTSASGLYLEGSSDNDILRSNGTSVTDHGVVLNAASDHNNLTGVYGVSDQGRGVSVTLSAQNSLVNVFGSSNGSSGVYLNFADNTTLTNNSGLSDAYYGIEVSYSSNVVLTNSTGTTSSFAGIILEYSSAANLSGNLGRATASGGAGLYLLHSSSNSLVGDEGRATLNSGIVLYDASNNSLEDTVVSSNNSAGLYFTYGSENNTILNITLRSNQTGISLSESDNNVVTDASMTLGPLASGVFSFSSDANTFTGLEIPSSKIAISLSNSSNNSFVDSSSLVGSDYDVYVDAANPSLNNTFLNCTFGNESVNGAANYIVRSWYYDANVSSSVGAPLSGANVSAFNASEALVSSQITDANGDIDRFALIEYVDLGGVLHYQNNFTANVSLAGYLSQSSTHNLSVEGNVFDTFVLGTDFPPIITFNGTFVNATTAHSFTVEAGVSDGNGASDIESVSIDYTGGSCSYDANSTSGNYFNATYSCSGTPFTSTSLNITFCDHSANCVTTATSSNSYPNEAPSVPVPDLPLDGNHSIRTRHVFFNWSSSSDAESDSLTYVLNVTNPVAPDYVRSGLPVTSNTSADELWTEYETFNSDYVWRVRACDDWNCSAWSAPRNFSIDDYLSVELVNDAVSFGSSLSLGSTNDTTDDDPLPFRFRNDGIILANLSNVTTSALWGSVALGTPYYQFMAGNASGEPSSFDWGASLTSWTDVPATYLGTVIGSLNYSDASDEAEVEVAIQVPGAEFPGDKHSTMAFTWRAALE